MLSTPLPTIAMMWIGGSLTWLEQLCMKSFLKCGHKVVLYCYDEVAQIPEGIEVRDANEIYPSTRFLLHARTGSPAFHADIFRLYLFKKTDYIWADTDAYCLKPWRLPEHGHFYAYVEKGKSLVANGVMRLPSDSPALDMLIEFLSDEYPIPPWFSAEQKKRLEFAKNSGNPVHISLLPWGVSGPNAFTYFLHKTGEIKYCMPVSTLYPVSYGATHIFLWPGRKRDVEDHIQEDTISVHFYGRRFREVASNYSAAPQPESYIADLMSQHDVDWKPTAYLLSDRESHHTAALTMPKSVSTSAISDDRISKIIQSNPSLAWPRRKSKKPIPTVEIEEIVTKQKDMVFWRHLNRERRNLSGAASALEAYAPRSIACAGSDYGEIPLLLHNKFDCDVVIVSEDHVSSMSASAVSKDFLVDNGIGKKRIKTFNKDNENTTIKTQVDALVYMKPYRKRTPLSHQIKWIKKIVLPGGVLIAQIRRGSGDFPKLNKLGHITRLETSNDSTLIAIELFKEDTTKKRDSTAKA